MKNIHSNRFFKTNCGKLAEEIHDKDGIVIGEQIICNAYPSISDRLVKNDDTIIYRLKVEELNTMQFILDFRPSAYLFRPNQIKHKLAKKAIFPLTGMDRRFNAYLKYSAEQIMSRMNEMPGHPEVFK